MSLLILSDPHHPSIRDRLAEWLLSIGDNPGVGYLAAGPDPTREFFQPIVALYDGLGIEITAYAEPIHGPNFEMYDYLFDCEIIHLSCGNSFEYLHHLHASGLLPRLRAFVAGGGHLVGTGAGAMLMTPDIGAAVYCGDEPLVPKQVTEALALVPFRLIPNVRDKDALSKRLAADGLSGDLYLLSEADALLVANGEIIHQGAPRLLAL